MPKRIGNVCVIAGVVLILSALLLFLYNCYEDKKAGQEADRMLADVQAAIAEMNAGMAAGESSEGEALLGNVGSAGARVQGEADQNGSAQDVWDETAQGEATGDTEDGNRGDAESAAGKTVEIAGYSYVGYLTIPALKLQLPVIDDWSYKKLKVAPCRQSGAAQTDDLVIAAHNYKRHFGLLSKLKSGDSVTFTEMDGTENTYTLAKVEVLEPTQADVVLNSDHDLVLYTCTYGGATRVVAFCDRDTEEKQGED